MKGLIGLLVGCKIKAHCLHEGLGSKGGVASVEGFSKQFQFCEKE